MPEIKKPSSSYRRLMCQNKKERQKFLFVVYIEVQGPPSICKVAICHVKASGTVDIHRVSLSQFCFIQFIDKIQKKCPVGVEKGSSNDLKFAETT